MLSFTTNWKAMKPMRRRRRDCELDEKEDVIRDIPSMMVRTILIRTSILAGSTKKQIQERAVRYQIGRICGISRYAPVVKSMGCLSSTPIAYHVGNIELTQPFNSNNSSLRVIRLLIIWNACRVVGRGLPNLPNCITYQLAIQSLPTVNCSGSGVLTWLDAGATCYTLHLPTRGRLVDNVHGVHDDCRCVPLPASSQGEFEGLGVEGEILELHWRCESCGK